jgi:hypothetical protein
LIQRQDSAEDQCEEWLIVLMEVTSGAFPRKPEIGIDSSGTVSKSKKPFHGRENYV